METLFAVLGNHLDTIIVAIIALVLGVDRWRSGSGNLRKEIAADYKERNQQLEDKLKLNADEINKTNLEVAHLSGVVQEKDKHIESLTKILQGRNPEMMEVLKEIKEGNLAVQQFIRTTYELLKKSSDELGYQTELLEGSKKRDIKIDKASMKRSGVPIRIPVGGAPIKKRTRRQSL